jgi:hypothetical protein
VLARIVCHFRHDTAGKTRQNCSVLAKVVFEPLVGDARAVTLDGGVCGGSRPGPG